MTTARLKGPENHGGFSYQGVSYGPDADGTVDAPHEALDAAFSHGFTLAPTADAAGDSDAEEKSARKKK